MSGKLGIFDGFVMLKLIHRLFCASISALYFPEIIGFLQIFCKMILSRAIASRVARVSNFAYIGIL